MTAAAQALRPQTRRPRACTEQGFEFLRSSHPLFSTPVRREPPSRWVGPRPLGGDRRRDGKVKMEIEVLPRSHPRLDRSSLSGGKQLGRQTDRQTDRKAEGRNAVKQVGPG